MAGYSGKSLVEKLGVEAGSRFGVFDAPDGFDKTLGKLPDTVTKSAPLRGDHDVAIVFAKNEKGRAKRFAQVGEGRDDEWEPLGVVAEEDVGGTVGSR